MFMTWEEIHKHVSPDSPIEAVLHIGGHLAEESEVYGGLQVIWIEADKRRVEEIKKLVPDTHSVIHAVIGDKDGEEVTFHEANNGQSSSILELGTHKTEHPTVHYVDEYKVKTKRLDKMFTEIPNFVNMDIQGAEMLALKGMGELIHQVDYFYLEVNKAELYKGGALVEEIDFFLNEFKRVNTVWTPQKWGDALYVRRSKA